MLVGALAGWLAGKFVRGREFDLIRSIMVGIVGALLGGWLFDLLGINPGSGIIGNTIVAFVGASVLLVLIRWLSRVFGVLPNFSYLKLK